MSWRSVAKCCGNVSLLAAVCLFASYRVGWPCVILVFFLPSNVHIHSISGVLSQNGRDDRRFSGRIWTTFCSASTRCVRINGTPLFSWCCNAFTITPSSCTANTVRDADLRGWRWRCMRLCRIDLGMWYVISIYWKVQFPLSRSARASALRRAARFPVPLCTVFWTILRGRSRD